MSGQSRECSDRWQGLICAQIFGFNSTAQCFSIGHARIQLTPGAAVTVCRRATFTSFPVPLPLRDELPTLSPQLFESGIGEVAPISKPFAPEPTNQLAHQRRSSTGSGVTVRVSYGNAHYGLEIALARAGRFLEVISEYKAAMTRNCGE